MIPAGALVVDYSFARPNLADLKARNVVGVSRYIGGSAGKDLGAGERDAIWAAGLVLIPLNWEAGNADPLQGAALGKTHGIEAARQANLLNYPKSLPIVVSVDVGTTEAQWAAIGDYFLAFHLASDWPLAFYGGTNLGNHLAQLGLIQWIWKASASSWSTQASNHVVMVQQVTLPPNLAGVSGVDANYVVQPFPAWTPQTGVTDMPVLVHGDGPGNSDPNQLVGNGWAVYAIEGGYKTHISADAFPALKAAYGGSEPITVPQGSLDAIPNFEDKLRAIVAGIQVPAPVVNVPAPVVTVPALDLATVKALIREAVS